jgi:hypothetical protein
MILTGTIVNVAAICADALVGRYAIVTGVDLALPVFSI